MPPDDILGYIQVVDGVVVPDSFTANPNHRLLNRHGFFRLALRTALTEYVSRQR